MFHHYTRPCQQWHRTSKIYFIFNLTLIVAINNSPANFTVQSHMWLVKQLQITPILTQNMLGNGKIPKLAMHRPNEGLSRHSMFKQQPKVACQSRWSFIFSMNYTMHSQKVKWKHIFEWILIDTEFKNRGFLEQPVNTRI